MNDDRHIDIFKFSYLRYFIDLIQIMSMKKSTQGSKIHHAFDATPYVSHGLSKNEVLEIKDAYDLLDPNGTGKIDPNGTLNYI